MFRLRFLCVLLALAVLLMPTAGVFAADLPPMVHGIDVSGWQGGEIRWNAVRDDGAEFVILRAGTSLAKDEFFEANYQAAHEAGLDVGCYFYTYATTPEEVVEETAELLGWLEGKQLEYPVYFDMEDVDLLPLTNEERTTLALTFLKEVRDAGFCGGVYANKYWFEELLDLPTLAAQGEIWWAYWPESGQPDMDFSDYGLWQYASDGYIDGIYGEIDLNVAYKDYPAMMKRYGLNGFAADPMRGDANGDGRVNTTDARRVLQFAADMLDEEEFPFTDADVNEDGKVNTTDARLILQYAAGMIDRYPVSETLPPVNDT